MSVLASIGAAVANAIGPAISTAGALYANRENLKNQDYWNNYQIELANSAHQREVADLEAAGLNPILSAGGSGSSTPSLRAATIDNPTSSFANSAKAIGDSLTGKVTAEVKQAKADAKTASAYAKQARQLASAEREQAELDLDLSRLDADARRDAIEGTVSTEHYRGSGGVYADLVDQYRNEIKSGKYTSSLGHAVFEDIQSGISSAGDLVNMTKGIKGMIPQKEKPRRPQVERETHTIDRFDAKGKKVGSERRTRQRSRTR